MENNVARERKKTIMLVEDELAEKKNTAKKSSVVLVDSRACLIDSLVNEINISGHFQRVQSSGSVKEMLSTPEIRNINMVILSMDVFNTASQNDDVRSIRDCHGESTKIVFLADKLCIELIGYMTKNDINGVIPSSYSTEQAIACLKAIDAGVQFIPPGLLTENLNQPSVHGLIGKQKSHELYETLTPRQAQVLELLCIGRSNKYIAAELSLCESTVKVHVSEIMKRMGATSRTHASYLYSKMVDQNEADSLEVSSTD